MENVNSLFNDCYKTACEYNSLDKNSEEYRRNSFIILRELSGQSTKLFKYISDKMNYMGAKNVEELNINLKILPYIFYILMYSINYVDKDYGYFSSDDRSKHSAKFAIILMETEGFEDNFVRKNSWLANREIMSKMADGVRGIHKTLIQSDVRCLLKSMEIHRDEIMPLVSSRQQKFVDLSIRYVNSSVNGVTVYLPFI